MDPNMSIHYLAAEAEHKLIVARAEQAWRRLDPSRTPARNRLSVRLAAIVARLKMASGRSPIAPAPAVGQQGSPSAC
jgi:hypothetical protein